MKFTENIVYAFVLLVIVCNVSTAMRRRFGPPPHKNLRSRDTAKWGNITQQVDNFNPQDNRTYQMRYIYNNEWYQEGGPIIIYLGGEWAIAPEGIEFGLIADIAKAHKGFLFYTEHRYYGKSHPFQNLTTANLTYLSIDQSLADVASFIEYARETYNLQKSKVVVCGGSYSASMATWLRIKYPHLIDAAWASSAPVVSQIAFPEYFNIVSNSIKEVSSKCYDIIKRATESVRVLIQTPEGRAKLATTFHTCKPIRNEFPYNEYFSESIVDPLSPLIQYAQSGDIEEQCENIINTNSTDPLEKYADWVNTRLVDSCIDDYDDFVKQFNNTAKLNDIYRQWFYQLCTEFGWMYTITDNELNGGNQVTLNLSMKMCTDLFGSGFGLNMTQQAVKRTRNQYGGRTQALTKVVSIHGSIDPWHSLGILEDLNADAPARVVLGYSHCADMKSLSKWDTKEMKAAKQLVLDSIARWIK